MSLLEKLTNRAQRIYPRILLPESSDQRVLEAAFALSFQKIAKIVLLGNENKLDKKTQNEDHNLEFINPDDDKLKHKYAKTLFENRKHKGLDLDESLDLVNDHNVFAMLALKRGEVDGIVTGAITHSQKVLSNALSIIGVANNCKLVSSFFLMIFDSKHEKYGKELIFSDCAMNVNPDADELAEIAVSAYTSARNYFGTKPKVAMLSFSSNKNTKYSHVEKVDIATNIVKNKHPNIDIIGNIQLDAALDSDVLHTKSPEATFITPANVLIFPNLDSGNIGYKLVQRFSGAQAIGPILQGLAKPVNDLSRGCTIQEIIKTVIITANQCKIN